MAMHLCSECKLGLKTYTLDHTDTFCPYLCCHNGTVCTMYVPLPQAKNFQNTFIEKTATE